MKMRIWAVILLLCSVWTSAATAEAPSGPQVKTYAIAPGGTPTIKVATTYALWSYGSEYLQHVKYTTAKNKPPPYILFKTAQPAYKKEGTPLLNLGDVAVFPGKICILKKTKLPYYELTVLIRQAIDWMLYGDVPPNEFVVAPEKWYLYQRDTIRHALVQDDVGISFDFPVSPKPDPDATGPWDGYFVTYPYYKSIPATATHLVFEFQITASPGIFWNYKSELVNVGCDYAKAAFRVYIAKGGIYANDTENRWWYTQGYYLQNTEGVVTFSVPLDGDGWNNVYAAPATANRQSFLNTVANATWLGITYGGGCNYSHGVNVSNGAARFNLRRMYYQNKE